MTAVVRALLMLVLVFPCAVYGAQDRPDFSGRWKLDGARSAPARKTDATLHIVHRDPALEVETTIHRGAEAPRHAVQRYTTDGKPSVSTGADGDEFHTVVVWREQSLAFAIEEHEDGRILHSKESWTLKENGTVLERQREMPDGKVQTVIYLRQP